MVGDSQIGKTSLMVKYVEGSFDEDYIQTLGEYPWLRRVLDVLIICRRQLHGKDYLCPKNDNYFLDLGSWRAAGIC